MAAHIMLDESAAQLTSKLIEISQVRQSVLANNLANANTPGFIRKDVDFQGELRRALASGSPEAIGQLRAGVTEDPSNPARTDGNNVVVAQEMSEIMQNGVYHNLLAKALTTRINILRSAIR